MLSLTPATDPATDSVKSLRVPPGDYDVVRRTIEYIVDNWRDQPSLDDVARATGVKPLSLQRLFTRWAGLSPKAFIQALTLDRARTLLADSASVLDATYEVGPISSSPTRR